MGDEPVWEEWLRADVLATFCPGYSPDDPTVVDDDKTPAPAERTEFKPRLARIQAGKLPDGEGARHNPGVLRGENVGP